MMGRLLFSDGVAGPQAGGSEDPREVRLERVAQSIERIEAAVRLAQEIHGRYKGS